ncbi:hypothetical protein SRRS_52450 [Sporomusa rhizae]|uniref:IS110 family transposase n=1 Tax=Sporomusa rhizae TaxID=357999 RepID=UPI00352AC86A
MLINRPAIGIDVAKDFCVYAAVSPNGTILVNPFKALNTKKGLFFALGEIKKVEDAFGSKPAIVLESTGHFSQRIVHFFLKQELDVFHINPLISHSIKNSSVRKVKTDQVDAVDLAKLFFTQDLHNTYIPSEALANLKTLSRTRFQLVEQRAGILNQLIAAIEQVAPLFPKVFDPSSLTALTLLTQFPAPAEWSSTSNHKAIMEMLESLPRRGKNYAHKNMKPYWIVPEMPNLLVFNCQPILVLYKFTLAIYDSWMPKLKLLMAKLTNGQNNFLKSHCLKAYLV